MGRVAEGWKFTHRRGGFIGIRWRDENGKRKEVPLRTKDPVEAKRIAPLVYADHVNGTVKGEKGNIVGHPATPIKDLIAKWIVAIKPELGEKTDETYIIYGKHWLKHLKILADVRPASIGNYQRARLSVVLAGTVKLELSAMRRFFKWLKEQEYIRAVPEFPDLGSKVLGTNFKVRRRTKPMVVFSPEEMDKIIECCPEWSERKVHGKLFPVRGWFIVARDTGLRHTTIDGLQGRDLIVSGLHIRPENDKNRWERVIDITPRVRAVLESVMPANPGDVFFGHHEWGKLFFKAALKALGPEAADRMTPYDLKHGLVTQMFDAGAPETGIQFQVGTKSALRRYAHPNRKAGEEALKKAFGEHTGNRPPGEHGEQPKTSPPILKVVKSYTKPKSKNTVVSAAYERKKTRG
jgi:integrase